MQSKLELLRKYWRPLFSLVYMIIILFDFIIAPIFWAIIQGYYNHAIVTQWSSLTLNDSGIFHISAGAIMGITAYSRGVEKLEELKRRTGGGDSV